MLLTNNGALTITSNAVDPNDVVYQGGIAVKASTGQVYVEGGGDSYLGQIASHCRFANTFAGANFQNMSRVKHISYENISIVQLVYSNIQLVTTSELNPTAATSVTASIEYPVGTITQATFSGSTTGNIPIGGVLVSDPITLATPLVRGVPFYTRTWQNAPGGMLYNATYGTNYGTATANQSGEFMVYGVTTTDLTNSTSIPNNGNTKFGLYGPQAIIGETTRRTILMVGDSRVQGSRYGGNGEYLPNQYGATGYVERALSRNYAVLNLGLGGESSANASGSGYVARASFINYCNTVVSNYGINDITTNSATPAQIITNLVNLAGDLGNKPFYQCTLDPVSTSTDRFTTTVNQTTNTYNSNRVTLNNLIRTGLSAPITGYIEVADSLESSRDSGLWKATTRTAADLSITAGTTTLTSAADFNFTSNDIGNAVLIDGAGGAGGLMKSYITNVTNSTTATLANTAGTTVAAASGSMPYTSDGTHASRLGTMQFETLTVFDALKD